MAKVRYRVTGKVFIGDVYYDPKDGERVFVMADEGLEGRNLKLAPEDTGLAAVLAPDDSGGDDGSTGGDTPPAGSVPPVPAAETPPPAEAPPPPTEATPSPTTPPPPATETTAPAQTPPAAGENKNGKNKK